MGVPVHHIKTEINRYGIHVFSSNYTLYGDIRFRVNEPAFKGQYVKHSVTRCLPDSNFQRLKCKKATSLLTLFSVSFFTPK